MLNTKIHIIPVLLLACPALLGSCSGLSSRTYQTIEYNYDEINRVRDSASVKLIVKSRDNTFSFEIKYPEENRNLSFSVSENDANYKIEEKNFVVEDKEYLITRIDNADIAVHSGKAYYYFYEGRLLIIKSRAWPVFHTYISETGDKDMIRAIIEDKTCFFNCPPPEYPEEEEPHYEEQPAILPEGELNPDSTLWPTWVKQELLPDIKQDYTILSREILAFAQINDSLSFCVYELSDGACNRSYLSTQINKKNFHSIEIAHSCEHDQSNPAYSWKEYDFIDRYIIKTTEYREFIPEELLEDGINMKENTFYDDYEKQTDSIIQYFQVIPEGELVPYTPESDMEIHSQ